MSAIFMTGRQLRDKYPNQSYQRIDNDENSKEGPLEKPFTLQYYGSTSLEGGLSFAVENDLNRLLMTWSLDNHGDRPKDMFCGWGYCSVLMIWDIKVPDEAIVLIKEDNSIQTDRYVMTNPRTFGSYLNEQSEEAQLMAVNTFGELVGYIDKPSEKVQLAAVKQDYTAIGDINNPSEAIQLVALGSDLRAWKYIKNPSPTVIQVAIESPQFMKLFDEHGWTYGLLIDIMNKGSEAQQQSLIQRRPETIRLLKEPSEELKLAIVGQDGLAIRWIENPSLAVQLVAIRQNREAIRYIKNPLEGLKL